MMKQIGALYLLCVHMAQRNDGVMNNKPVFYINYGSSAYYCAEGLLHTIILNTNSLISVTLSVKQWYFEIVLW